MLLLKYTAILFFCDCVDMATRPSMFDTINSWFERPSPVYIGRDNLEFLKKVHRENEEFLKNIYVENQGKSCNPGEYVVGMKLQTRPVNETIEVITAVEFTCSNKASPAVSKIHFLLERNGKWGVEVSCPKGFANGLIAYVGIHEYETGKLTSRISSIEMLCSDQSPAEPIRQKETQVFRKEHTEIYTEVHRGRFKMTTLCLPGEAMVHFTIKEFYIKKERRLQLNGWDMDCAKLQNLSSA